MEMTSIPIHEVTFLEPVTYPGQLISIQARGLGFHFCIRPGYCQELCN